MGSYDKILFVVHWTLYIINIVRYASAIRTRLKIVHSQNGQCRHRKHQKKTHSFSISRIGAHSWYIRFNIFQKKNVCTDLELTESRWFVNDRIGSRMLDTQLTKYILLENYTSARAHHLQNLSKVKYRTYIISQRIHRLL